MPCLSCVPWCSGAQLDKSQTASALFAHYSHYLASNQRRTGCWDLSATHKGPGSLVGLPASALIRKGVHRGGGGGGTQIGAQVRYRAEVAKAHKFFTSSRSTDTGVK